MNDATDPVGGEPWLVAGAEAHAEGGAPSAWNDPGQAPPPDDFADTADGLAPGLPDPDSIDWEAWAASDPQGAEAAWEAFEAQARQTPPEDDPERAGRLEAARAELERDIEGWSPELAADLAVYGQARGFTAEELAAVEDPREVKILHLAMLGEQALAAQRHEQRFGRFRPPTQVGGRGHPGHLSDHSSTDAWMQARHTQLRKKARR